MRRWHALIAVLLLVVAVVSCSSNKTPLGASKPSGIDGAVWDQYCIHGSNLVDVLKQAENGTITGSELVSKLDSVQSNIHNDSLAASVGGAESQALGVKMQAVSDAIGRAKVAVDSGGTPDLTAIASAASVLPTCT